MQRSWPLVRTSPPASSSRNLAGRMIRPFSSRRGECVPRNTAHRPSVRRKPNVPCAATTLLRPPHYSTSLHSQRHAERFRVYLWQLLPGGSLAWHGNGRGGGKWRALGGAGAATSGRLAGNRRRTGRLTAKDPPERVFCATWCLPVVGNGGSRIRSVIHGSGIRVQGSVFKAQRSTSSERASPAACQDSPRCRSSQRSSRLLMNELLGLPGFLEVPALLAFPAAEPRMVA